MENKGHIWNHQSVVWFHNHKPTKWFFSFGGIGLNYSASKEILTSEASDSTTKPDQTGLESQEWRFSVHFGSAPISRYWIPISRYFMIFHDLRYFSSQLWLQFLVNFNCNSHGTMPARRPPPAFCVARNCSRSRSLRSDVRARRILPPSGSLKARNICVIGNGRNNRNRWFGFFGKLDFLDLFHSQIRWAC